MFWVFLTFCAVGSLSILAVMLMDQAHDRRMAMLRLDEEDRRMGLRHADEERRLRMRRAGIERRLARRRNGR